MRFSSRVELGGKTATGIEVPADTVTALAAGSRPAVVVTVNGHRYRTTVATRAGRFLVPLSAENRTAAGVQAGDAVEVEIEPDTALRVVEVPDDLAAALAAAGARAAFDALSYSRQRGLVEPVQAAKAEETRRRRVSRVVEDLLS